ncbi:MAG: ROK family protein [Mariprofundus sp.]|nr:ROK family protein [Mariprofundus sp.]
MRIGIDLGGTKTELIALDRQGNERLRFRRPTPTADYTATITQLAEMVRYAEQQLQQSASVGIATPGAISTHSGLMKNCNSTCLNGKPLQDDLEYALQRPIRISNDANCFALSEATDGAASGCAVVFAVILGTGVGGGIVINGELVEGANRIAGEWGHNPLPLPTDSELPGPDCYCGRCGCIETWLSGPAMSLDHYRQSGQHLSAQQLSLQAVQGHKACLQTVNRYCERLAKSLASVVNILDPNIIVVGGGLSNISIIYQKVVQLWQPYLFTDSVETRLLPPMHGDSSGVRGAAWLWSE